MRGQRQVKLDRGKYTTCVINLHGATITSWRVENKEQLYVNKRCNYDNKSSIRGGVSLAFPHYGHCSFGPDFGFASIHSWTVKEPPRVLDNGDVTVTLFCEDNHWSRSMWDHAFCLTMNLTLCEVELEMNYKLVNRNDTERVDFHLCVFASLRVSDVSQTFLLGLGGCIFSDRTLKLPDYLRTFVKDKNMAVRISEKTDRLYRNTPRSLFLVDPLEKRIVRVAKSHLRCSMVSNPWDGLPERKPEVLHDYVNYLTVGAGECLEKIVLDPGGQFEANFKIQLDPFSNKTGDLMELERKGVTFWTLPVCSPAKCDCSCYCRRTACYCACYCEKN